MALVSIEEAQALFNAGRIPAARSMCEALLQREPGNFDATYLMALIAQRQGHNEDAIALLRRAISIRQDLPALHFVLGNVYRTSGQIERAIESYRAALRLKPDDADVLVNLGIALASSGQRDEARSAWQRALELNPRDADALSNLGNLARSEGRIGEAIHYAERALAINPNLHTTLSNLAVAYGRQGRLDEAIATYRRALAINPRSPRIHSNLLLDMTYHDRIAPEDLFAEHRKWNQLFATPLHPAPQAPPAPTQPIKKGYVPFYDVPTDSIKKGYVPFYLEQSRQGHCPPVGALDLNRPLRVGYVSADFREHAVAYFIEPVLRAHNPKQVEVFCYFAAPREDEVTRRLKSYGGRWQRLWGVRDEQAAEMVRADAIDILVDLSVHTSGNRLLLFARKPAPVQVTWLGYAGTTGMDAMDYRLTDPIVDPPGLTESLHSEQLFRLPRTQWCYLPPADAPAISPPPCEANGYVTFGSATNLAKVTPTSLDLWRDVLNAVPGSKFALLARGLDEGSTRDFIAGQFQIRGIDPDRLHLVGGGDLGHYLNFFSQVDISLDTHPFAGGTTTCHTLWMGVPVVTMTGRTSVSRVAASVLTNVGLEELIANSPGEFVPIAARLASDRKQLSHLRATMRDRIKHSPLLDSVAFTKDLEAAYQAMWQNWCTPAR
jgi:predicted O-linked N-acetylglucosamine transferase (SPINDLY family)